MRKSESRVLRHVREGLAPRELEVRALRVGLRVRADTSSGDGHRAGQRAEPEARGGEGWGGEEEAGVSAVMVAELLYPSGLGHDLLCEWALFARDDREEGAASWSVKPRVDRGWHGDPPDRWYVVNRIVSRLLKDHPDYRQVVKPVYLGERAPSEV